MNSTLTRDDACLRQTNQYLMMRMWDATWKGRLDLRLIREQSTIRPRLPWEIPQLPIARRRLLIMMELRVSTVWSPSLFLMWILVDVQPVTRWKFITTPNISAFPEENFTFRPMKKTSWPLQRCQLTTTTLKFPKKSRKIHKLLFSYAKIHNIQITASVSLVQLMSILTLKQKNASFAMEP